jgi:hypothetical protein
MEISPGNLQVFPTNVRISEVHFRKTDQACLINQVSLEGHLGDVRAHTRGLSGGKPGIMRKLPGSGLEEVFAPEADDA